MLIFEKSQEGRRATAQSPKTKASLSLIPSEFLRKEPAVLPEVSELQTERHYTKLSQKNFSIAIAKMWRICAVMFSKVIFSRSDEP